MFPSLSALLYYNDQFKTQATIYYKYEYLKHAWRERELGDVSIMNKRNIDNGLTGGEQWQT